MLRSHRAMSNDISKLANKYEKEIELEARKVMERHPRLKQFSAAMGTECFYDETGYPIDDDDLPETAKKVIDFCADYLRHFGSPEIHI